MPINRPISSRPLFYAIYTFTNRVETPTFRPVERLQSVVNHVPYNRDSSDGSFIASSLNYAWSQV